MATPTHNRKLRRDSKFAQLTLEQQDELATLLLQGELSHEGAVEWCRERGVRVSRQSVSEYYRTRVLPQRWRFNNASAKALAKLTAKDAEEAVHTSIIQALYEITTTPGAMDEKQVANLYKLMLDGIRVQHEGRKLELLERRAAQAEQAEAALGSQDMTEEQQLAAVRRIFGISEA